MALKIPKEIFEKLPWLNTLDRFTRTRNNLSESVLSPTQTENFIMKTLEMLANGGGSGGDDGSGSTPGGTSDIAKVLALSTIITKYTVGELKSKLTKGSVQPVYSLFASPGPPNVSILAGLSFYIEDSVPIVIIGLGLSNRTGVYDGIYIGRQISNVSTTDNDSFEWVKIPFTTN